MTKRELVDMLSSTKELTLQFFDVERGMLDKSYGKGKWSIRQILHHLTDSELIYHERLKRVIAGPRQVIWAYDQDQWNEAFDYKNEPLRNKKTVFGMLRNLNCELIEKYHEISGEKEFVHSEGGLRTLREEFERVALHNQNHIQQIQIALST